MRERSEYASFIMHILVQTANPGGTEMRMRAKVKSSESFRVRVPDPGIGNPNCKVTPNISITEYPG